MALAHRALGWLPAGRGVPAEAFPRTHSATCWLLWCHVPGLLAFGVLRGQAVGHLLLVDLAPVIVLAALASWPAPPARFRSVAASLGLMAAAAAVVHLADGRTEAHFHFFVLIVVLSRYDDWWPLGTAVAFVLVEHGLVAALAPESLYSDDDRDLAIQTLVHAGYVLAASVAGLAVWSAHERQRDRAEVELRRTAAELAVSEAAQRAAAEALAEAEARLRAAFDGAAIGQSLVDADGRLLRVNAALCRLVGRSEEELRGLRFGDVTHPEDRRASLHDFARCVRGEVDAYQVDQRYVRPDGSVVHARTSVAAIRQPEAAPTFLAQVEDVTEQKAAMLQLRWAATHDQLTGLPNRALLHDRLTDLAEDGRPCAVLFIDLDRFKDVNDNLGHAAGDRVLVAVAQRLREAVGDGATIARLGGDEFAVLVAADDDEAPADRARRLASAVLQAVRRPVEVGLGRQATVTASIGLSAAGHDGEALLEAADLALYRAKGLGRARVEEELAGSSLSLP